LLASRQAAQLGEQIRSTESAYLASGGMFSGAEDLAGLAWIRLECVLLFTVRGRAGMRRRSSH
jgi:hypothetical protein